MTVVLLTLALVLGEKHSEKLSKRSPASSNRRISSPKRNIKEEVSKMTPDRHKFLKSTKRIIYVNKINRE